ncbi:dethiobiotin synthase [Halorientalis sp. IM1011]|uniref:dethiobiotin synthase n=1 Tax=Halorientalis sp. IM1011 TaxID=1932360 RepID=UPI00097CD18E|nr:dethiobiotin synthase [Halorientalis sp. IM1011]AQL44395.1 dethiobiotin synthase [Halorientalis sp. IM1011]
MTGGVDEPRDLAVVGTDTGVGKTVVTAGLVGRRREEGLDARAIKPCQTGYPPDDDAAFVTEACDDESAATCLRRLEPALAPAVAAERTGEDLSYERIIFGCRDAVADAEVGIVEGIGGLRVPLADGREVVDLVSDLDLPALVVARSGLGTLNHTALTVEALRRRDVPVAGVVLNEYASETTAERTNPDALQEMTGLPVETIPPLPLDDPSDAVAGVREHLPDSLVPAE